MADDDTFDIDIYGDDANDQSTAAQNAQDGDDLIFDDDEQYGNNSSTHQNGQANSDSHAQPEPQEPQPTHQGTKRKAPDDEGEEDSTKTAHDSPAPQTANTNANISTKRRAPDGDADFSLEPNATPALKLADLHWWTTEEDVRAFCARAGVEDDLRDISFGEHKINGKSRGEVYLEFGSAQAASAVKAEIERSKKEKKDGGRTAPFNVGFSPVSNPFKGRDGGASGVKKDYNSAGAYNSSGRGGAYNNNNFQNRGGYNNRGRGGMNGMGMMNNMMGRGGMNGMNMMGANMGRGGMAGMAGRGGWGGGFQQNMQQGGFNAGAGNGGYGNMQQGQNKRMKSE